MEGSTATVTAKEKAKANKLHKDLVEKMKKSASQFMTSTGRATFIYTAVNSIGPVISDPIN